MRQVLPDTQLAILYHSLMILSSAITPSWGAGGKVPAGGLGVSPNLSLHPQERGAGVSLPGVWGCPPIYSHSPTRGCRGLPAGGLGVSPSYPLPNIGGAGLSLPGVWGCPPIYPLPLHRGAGASLPGVWGCPPTSPFIPKQGVQGPPCRGFGGVPQFYPYSQPGGCKGLP